MSGKKDHIKSESIIKINKINKKIFFYADEKIRWILIPQDKMIKILNSLQN
jgi:hypothetical protein